MSEAVVNSTSGVGLDLVWGVRRISEVIELSERATFYMLESNRIPCARKVGGRWVSSRSKLEKFFHDLLAAGE